MKSIVAIAAIAFCSVAFAGQDEVLKNSQSSVSSSASASKQMTLTQSMGGSVTRSHSDSESSASQADDIIVTKSRCKTVRKNNVREELCVTQTRHVSPNESERYLRQLEK